MKLSSIKRNFILIIVLSLVFLLADNPWKFKTSELPVVGPVWNWFQESHVHLGLDLQGGTQLDYEISLTEAKARNADDDDDNDVDIDELISGVKDVIERRVDALGVAEPKITIEEVGDETHIVVALPGIDNLEEAKERVGKVVQLEFKTQKEGITDEEKAAVAGNANHSLQLVLADKDADLEDLALDMEGAELKEAQNAYADTFPNEIRALLPSLVVGETYAEVVDAGEGFYYDQSTQNVVEVRGFNIVKLTSQSRELREIPVNAEDFETVGAEAVSFESFEYAREKDVQSDLEDTVKDLTPGEVSDVIELDDKFAIVKLTEELSRSENKGDWRMRATEIFIKLEQIENYTDSPLKLLEITDEMTEEEKVKAEEENVEIQKKNDEISIRKAEVKIENKKVESRNDKVRAKAIHLLEQMRAADEGTLAQLVADHSESEQEILDKAGDTGYFGPSEKIYENSLFEIKAGEVIEEIYEDSDGIYLLKLADFKRYDEERFSYQVMKTDTRESANELQRRVREEDTYSLQRIFFNAQPNPWQNTELDGKYFKRADVQYDQTSFVPYVSITFNDEGGELFADITEANIQKPIAIFVGGELISAPIVQARIAGGTAQITLGTNDVRQALEEATELARNLNAGAIPAPLKKPNELNIGSTLGADALSKSLKAGLIGLVLLAVYMIFAYRFMGLLAVAALGVYGLTLLFFVQSEVPQLASALLVFIGWILTAGKIMSSKSDAWSKLIFITLSVAGIYFVFSIFVSPIVLTLAGVAGVILSIGMAVDANILIFERIKEEFALGKSFAGSVRDGFDRAWPSILDSNVSSLITCAILGFFGTSIIKGFATNLAIGIIVSMFSAIYVTRTFLIMCEGTRLEKIDWLWKRK